MKTMMVILKSKEKVHFEVREEGQAQGQIKITEEEMDSEKDEIYPKLHNEKHTRERELPVIHTNQASINPSYEPGMVWLNVFRKAVPVRVDQAKMTSY